MWSWAYVWRFLPDLLEALQITIGATLVGFTLAIVVGLMLAIAGRSSLKLVSRTAGGFIMFVRSTPLLVQLYFLFYVLPKAGVSLTPFTAGVLGLGLHYSTYLAEVFRAGIEAIRRGQWEAATALNFTRYQAWSRIILPQAIPPVVPVLGNYLIVMFKETPLLSAITLVELVLTAKMIGSASFDYLEPFTMVGVLFLVLSYPTALLVRRLEWAMQVKRRG